MAARFSGLGETKMVPMGGHSVKDGCSLLFYENTAGKRRKAGEFAVARRDGYPGVAAGQGLGLCRGLKGVPLMAAGALTTPLQGLRATG